MESRCHPFASLSIGKLAMRRFLPNYFELLLLLLYVTGFRVSAHHHAERARRIIEVLIQIAGGYS